MYCPYGPSARDASAFLESLEALKQLGREQHVTFIRVEPENPDFTDLLATSHWKPVTYQQLQPTHSRVIDLTPSEDKLIAQMAQPVRNIYRNYDKKGISVHHSDDPADITIFLRFVHEVAERTGIHPHSDQYFEKIAKTLFPLGAASLWYVAYNDTPIAAALFYDSSDTRIYAHAGASSLPEHRKLNASTALLAEAIMTPSTKSSLASTSTASLQTTLPLHTRGQALRGSSDPSAAKMSHLQAPGICHSTHQGIGYIERIRQPTEKYDRRRNYTLLTSYVLYWG